MPFHGNHHQNAAFTPSAALSSAAQALGSIGAPHGNLRVATSGTTSAGTDAFITSPTQSTNSPHSAHGQTAPPQASGLPPPPQHHHQHQPPQQQQSSAYDARRAPNLPPSMSQQPEHYSAPASSSNLNMNIHQNPPPPQPSQYSPAPPLPGSLQPGGAQHQQQQQQQRPAPAAAYTAPSAVPQINSNAQQYTLPTRSNTNQSQPPQSQQQQQAQPTSHSYSRSSPAGLGPDQKYIPFSNTPENPKYTAATPSQKYYPSTPSGAASNSPLGLADIRPRALSNMTEDAMGTSSIFNDTDRVPSNSNYVTPWPAYAFDWCKWNVHGGNSAGKMAVGSFLEDTHNFIQILDTHLTPQEVSTPGAPQYGLEYTRVAEATCSYPVTRILWEPPSSQKQSTDLLATSGDHLRLWSLPQSTGSTASNTISRSSSVNTREPPPQKLTPLALLSNSKTPEHTAPLTSLDWNTMSPKLIITSSIDTTCTIWDIPTLTAKTQLIAHDKEVFDVRFCAGSVDVFVSCGADGSVRMFDLRSLEHSTIIYEPSEKQPGGDKGSPGGGRMSPTKAQQTMSYAPPLLRLSASPHDSHLLATFAADSNLIRILDVRQPGQALLELCGHSAPLNSIEWNPSRRGMLASGADDSLVLIWDLLHSQNGAVINGDAAGSAAQPPTPASAHPANGGSAQGGNAAATSSGTGGTMGRKGPYQSWRCEYEVGNISWAPQSALTGSGGEWLGVCGGKGIWGVKL
ncbi:WD40 repeat-like protein [Periconia macrospinosa]|uniref:WD40 repeat-like protein n=1 Tax=Periconia macrospinosa TaxID=97972 RepID=A0A2V1D0R8_9PLEO|nr:WD40 repeat-like protein [Periconia macrospinosa]